MKNVTFLLGMQGVVQSGGLNKARQDKTNCRRQNDCSPC